MNKAGLTEALASKTGLSKSQAENVLNAMVEVVTDTLKGGDEVAITGFGTFSAKNRAARQGVNPKTGEKIQIPAMTVPKFKAGKGLKDALK